MSRPPGRLAALADRLGQGERPFRPYGCVGKSLIFHGTVDNLAGALGRAGVDCVSWLGDDGRMELGIGGLVVEPLAGTTSASMVVIREPAAHDEDPGAGGGADGAARRDDLEELTRETYNRVCDDSLWGFRDDLNFRARVDDAVQAVRRRRRAMNPPKQSGESLDI